MAVLKNIILDWSGTLADDIGPVLAATNHVFVQYGKPEFTVEAFRASFELPFANFYARELPEVDLAEAGPVFHKHMTANQDKVELLPGARDFLDFCRSQSMSLFLLTAVPVENLEYQARRLGVLDHFTGIYANTEDKRKTILHLLAEHNLDAHETVFVGDMIHDIEAANKAGVVSCAVLTGYDTVEKLKPANPELLFRDLEGLRLYIQRHGEDAPYQPIATVGALIGDGAGKVLMFRTHKWSHKWGIPGGKIKPDEPSLKALRREIREETNLEIDSIQFELVQDCIQPPEFFKQAHFLLLNYSAIARPVQEVILNEEAEEYCWVTLDEALAMDINGPTRVLLEHVKARGSLPQT